ncbi:MAG TPA: CDP-alcohol phosphatidyltransferase family protein [Albitalea sp.]|nr:CDP-alcohol phosphatidyltransferase family protein [Albitalea sp.]
MLNVANAITLLRFLLVPALALGLLRSEYSVVLVLLIVSALSDLADGIVARRWSQATRFGAVADPLADKLTMLTVAGLLTLQHALPWWFALAVVLRDVLIVGGAMAYHLWIGPVAMTPSRISKLNTAMEFLVLLAVLAIQAGYVPDGLWRQVLLFATLATVASSGTHYVVLWARKAMQAHRITV